MDTCIAIIMYCLRLFLLFTGKQHCLHRGGVEGPAGTANAVPLFTVVRIAVPLFKAGRTGTRTCHPECAIVARVRIVHTDGPVP